MTDLQSLYAGICAQPDEDTPRLALADFLDEQGGKDNQFRADFIRTHCQLSREEPWSEPWRALNSRWIDLRNRVDRLAAGHKLPWVSHLKTRVRAFYFERGLVGELTLFSKRFVSEGASYFEQDPIRGVKFVKLNSTVGTVKPDVLFACPHLSRLAKLDLDGSGLKDADVASLAASPHLKNLRWLGLGGYHHFGAAAVPKLLKALPALSELHFTYNGRFSDGHLSSLAKCPELARVAVLDVAGTHTTARGVAGLLKGRHTTGLTVLRIGSVIQMDEEHGYVTAPQVSSEDGLATASAVASAPGLAGLQELALSRRAIGDDGVNVLCEAAKALPALRRLDLNGNALTLDGVTALARSELGQRLLYVNLSENPGLVEDKKKLKKMFPAAHVEGPLDYVD